MIALNPMVACVSGSAARLASMTPSASVAGMLSGIERQLRNKQEPDPDRLLGLLHRRQDEAVKAGRTITRIALAFEAGRDGFWLARWLATRGVEAHVIHASSVAVSREPIRCAASVCPGAIHRSRARYGNGTLSHPGPIRVSG
jgi:hypothetical protein